MKIDKVVALVRSHYAGDTKMFDTVVEQISADESSKQNYTCVQRIRAAKEAGARNSHHMFRLDEITRNGSHERVEPVDNLPSRKDLVLDDAVSEVFDRLVLESQKRELLRSRGLTNNRKVLLFGDSGTGKTSFACAFAKEIGLPMYVVRLEKLVDSLLGKTSQNLYEVFKTMKIYPGVYLFDEFDSIGISRDDSRDVGEMRRIMASLLQFVERDDSDGFIFATTNMPQIIDKALYRRFDEMVEFKRPTIEVVDKIAESIIGRRLLAGEKEMLSGMSHADASNVCKKALKRAILADRVEVCCDDILACARSAKESRSAMASFKHDDENNTEKGMSDEREE